MESKVDNAGSGFCSYINVYASIRIGVAKSVDDENTYSS